MFQTWNIIVRDFTIDINIVITSVTIIFHGTTNYFYSVLHHSLKQNYKIYKNIFYKKFYNNNYETVERVDIFRTNCSLKYFPFSRSVVRKKKNNRFFPKFSPQQKMSRLIFIVRYNATSTSLSLFRFFLFIPKKISKIFSKSRHSSNDSSLVFSS